VSERPVFFEEIQQKAAARWDQLESDPELAAPWWQLFKQVQSPRHIVSELLQNADDAGATEAVVKIEGDAFIFEHNGEDFSEEHFSSLCKFGFSNKRALHTIGFRGIGFKSTFSLGRQVELYTPTLSVAFDQERFTEPKWSAKHKGKKGITTVYVAIEDLHRRTEVEKNLQEWLKSPVSLLFFRHLRRITIGEEELHWGSCGPGPIPYTEWLALLDNQDEIFLLARSAPESFPEDALVEIRQERMLQIGEGDDFPPCSIEIVLGVEGRLYVVLPTGVKTNLPFACNAPFIQDPARLKIKDPETSPTNRWLLQRAGKLAAETLLGWLEQSALSIRERADAYSLMMDVDRSDSSLEGTCGTIVETSFSELLDERAFLLTEEGQLVADEESIIIPRSIFDVWPNAQAVALFDDEGRPALSQYVSDADREKLVSWGRITEINEVGVLTTLHNKHLPKPSNWHRLLNLWSYLEPTITGYKNPYLEESLCIVPVQGRDILYPAAEVVRIGEKKLVPSEDDWQFLGDKLFVLNQNWLRFLTEKRRLAERDKNDTLKDHVDAADAVLKAISLQQPSDTGKVIDSVAGEFFAQDELPVENAVRMAQIAAKLGAKVGDAFHFVTQDDFLRPVDESILIDIDGTLEILLPEEWAKSHLLHPDYLKTFTSCTRQEWRQWVSSGLSGLLTCVPFTKTKLSFVDQKNMEQELIRRQFKGDFKPHYSYPWFQMTDWNVEEEIWQHWEKLAEDDPSIWGKAVEKILMVSQRFWANALTASISEHAVNGYSRTVISKGLTPTWILNFQEKACLRDTHGVYRKPAELLRRTPETEALRDVELFVDAHLDTSSVTPLLDLLGISATPTGPAKLLNRLRTLSQATKQEVNEVEKWYRRLDQLINDCSTEDSNTIITAFSKEKLILTESGHWEISAGVFLIANEEDAPEAETVRTSVRNLTFWRKIGVEDRPTPELAIKWLQSLSPGSLSQENARRARALLARHPVRVWAECGHWISLSGKWMPINNFSYALTLQPLIPWGHLHQWVKDTTANLQDLSVDVTQSVPFAGISLLAACVEEHFHKKSTDQGIQEQRGWLRQLGQELQRINLKDEEETERIRQLARELATTTWQTSVELEIIPYISGKPAGTPRHADAIWFEQTLYVEDKPLAKLARAIAQELERFFRNRDIIDAIKLCFERSPNFISEYMEGNFTLMPRKELEEITNDIVTEEKDTGNTEGENVGDTPDAKQASKEDEAGTDDDESSEEDYDDDEAEIDDDEIGDEDDDEEIVTLSRKKPKPRKPGIMERLALDHGFHKDGENRFYDEYGNWIAKANDSLFPWEQRTASGDVVRHYWPKDHCLEREPLQLEAEIWSIVEKFPETYILVLSDPEGQPREVTGEHLRTMQEKGELTLHPSTYRLVYGNEE
jgi:hypothetical protein